MNYPFLLNATQILGLLLMAGCAIAALRLLSVCFVLRDWNDATKQAFSRIATVQALGLLVFAFASGGLFALNFFKTSDLPPLTMLLFQVLLLLVLSGSVVFTLTIVRPWLAELPEGPLAQTIGFNRLTAITLAFSAFAAATTFWALLAWTGPWTVAGSQPNLGHFALMILLIWALLVVPSLSLSGIAAFLNRHNFSRDVEAALDAELLPRRIAPQLAELPQTRMVPARMVPAPMVHVPARRAPRPTLVPREDYAGNFAIA